MPETKINHLFCIEQKYIICADIWLTTFDDMKYSSLIITHIILLYNTTLYFKIKSFSLTLKTQPKQLKLLLFSLSISITVSKQTNNMNHVWYDLTTVKLKLDENSKY